VWFLGVRIEYGLHRQGYRRQELSVYDLSTLAVQILQLSFAFWHGSCMALVLRVKSQLQVQESWR
jgi:hypothetical protein